jgi:hypothetical protein
VRDGEVDKAGRAGSSRWYEVGNAGESQAEAVTRSKERVGSDNQDRVNSIQDRPGLPKVGGLVGIRIDICRGCRRVVRGAFFRLIGFVVVIVKAEKR